MSSPDISSHSASSSDKLVYMANQIAKFFESQGPDKAVAGTADHLKKFWDPRMRQPDRRPRQGGRQRLGSGRPQSDRTIAGNEDRRASGDARALDRDLSAAHVSKAVQFHSCRHRPFLILRTRLGFCCSAPSARHDDVPIEQKLSNKFSGLHAERACGRGNDRMRYFVKAAGSASIKAERVVE